MSTTQRVGAFVVVLVVVFGGAFGLGRVLEGDSADPGAGSYRLELDRTTLDASPSAPVRFVVRDSAARVVTDFALRHEKRLHLIAVRDDFSGFQHVHPTMTADGTWSTVLDLGVGGYRLFADFQERGADEAVASADLRVAGTPGTGPAPRRPGAARAATVDGYRVTLAGDLVVGSSTTLTLTVSRDGVPVTDLEPYLGAYGHLVVLRGSDKQYLHAHPEEGPAGPEVAFHVATESAGRYYLYLDFQHRGRVRTATFAVDAVPAPTAAPDAPTHGEGGGHDGH